MDSGSLCFDGLVGPSCPASDPETNHKLYGSSGFYKQQRSPNITEDDERSCKLAKSDERNPFPRSNNNTLFSGQGQRQDKILNFSCPKSAETMVVEKRTSTSQNANLMPYFQHTLSSTCNRNAVYNYGSLNSGNMHGGIKGVRGPFTPSQWMELEHQALIYKYISTNVPVPANLLIPIKKAFDSAGFSHFSGGFLSPNTLGCGSFHLGYSNSSTDPEPGRCRRTDGKKWRCSRDAVADQKYCERHMNRGRHRSRKPVEAQSGRSVAGVSNTTNSSTTKVVPGSSASALLPAGKACNSIAIANQQNKNLLRGSSHAAATTNQIERMYMYKENSRNILQEENPFFIQKQQISYQESPETEFGIVSSESLLNPSLKTSSLIAPTCKSFNSSQDPEKESENSFHQFIVNWPKNKHDRASAISWSGLDTQSGRSTQLSISIPMAPPSDIMSSTSSPAATDQKLTLSPPRLLREMDMDPVRMDLGMGNALGTESNGNSRLVSWIPISWEGSSMGGPLGEVLQHSNNNKKDNKRSSALDLMTTEDGWKKESCSLLGGSSPTGVLQKTSFGSLSNSSAGSSPRADKKTPEEGASFCCV